VKKLLWISAVLILTTRLLAQSNAPVRLALIAETDEAASASDVLTAQLSGNPLIHLLERNEIEKIYREQGVSAANKDYLKLGQILGADGLLLLETSKEGTNQLLKTRLVAVKPGVVIGNTRSQWPLPDLAGWSLWIVNHFNPLFPKLAVLLRDAVPLSVVNLRSAVRSSESEETERELTLLTIERLTRERELFVLERRRMELLSAEKELKGMDESKFWNGSYLLEGVVDRDGYSKNTVTLNASLTPPKGGTPIEIAVAGPRNELNDVVGKLTVAILASLRRNTTAPNGNHRKRRASFLTKRNGRSSGEWPRKHRLRQTPRGLWANGTWIALWCG